MRITKVEELANYKVQVLNQRFGKMGIKMKRVAKGVDFDEVEEREGVKSISRHITFDRRHRRPRKNCHVRRYACRWCTQQPDEKSLPLRTVTFVIRLNNFSTFTQAKTVPSMDFRH